MGNASQALVDWRRCADKQTDGMHSSDKQRRVAEPYRNTHPYSHYFPRRDSSQSMIAREKPQESNTNADSSTSDCLRHMLDGYKQDITCSYFLNLGSRV